MKSASEEAVKWSTLLMNAFEKYTPHIVPEELEMRCLRIGGGERKKLRMSKISERFASV